MRCYRTTEPRARKAHRCDMCHSEIATGAKYSHTRGLWEYEWITVRWCGRCVCCQGEHKTPEQALRSVANYKPGWHPNHPDIAIEDGTLRLWGRDDDDADVIYEADIMPGTGLGEWRLAYRMVRTAGRVPEYHAVSP